MRGKVSDDLRRNIRIGITPAYAGKSGGSIVEPRVNTGSPPPMRGKGDAGQKPRHCIRITPAYAGKSVHD